MAPTKFPLEPSKSMDNFYGIIKPRSDEGVAGRFWVVGIPVAVAVAFIMAFLLALDNSRTTLAYLKHSFLVQSEFQRLRDGHCSKQTLNDIRFCFQ